jgi:hypothetical protein
VVDTQFHLPAIVLLVLHLVVRLELAAPPASVPTAIRRPRLVLASAVLAVVVGALLLVPIDVAMVRAAVGNAALDRGDPAAALGEFDAAVALHGLPPYRLGQASAHRARGDDVGAADALHAMAQDEAFTFTLAQEAALSEDPTALWRALDEAGPYDPTATVNLAAQRFAVDPASASRDLASAMVQVPTLVYSARPEGLFDDSTWAQAQAAAISRIGVTDHVMASAVAALAGLPTLADAQRSAVPAGPERDALDLLDDVVAGGDADLERARALLRVSPASSGLQTVLWLAGFRGESQPILDAVRAVAVPLYFNVPTPPMELVLDGRADADYSMRLPRWPMASAGRNGPKRPYIDGFITIEPVYRPKP